MKQDQKFRIPIWFPDLDKLVIDKLLLYQKELLKFNNTINLISARLIDETDRIHFADSILGGQIVLRENDASEIYDIGSGNGFPGLVMAVMSPEIKFVLVDSDRRKSEFLKHMVSVLGLSNVTVRVARLETLHAGTIHTAVCRAFSHLPRTLLISRKAMADGGKFFNFKGNEWSFEIAQLPEQLCSTWNTGLVEEYKLPESEIVHSIVLASKKKKK
jgi:16S rRNA (guanine527-N7)-methyltransferase